MTAVNYKNAFNCKRCPGNNTPAGCPLWWETIHTNIQTGEIKTIKSCGFTQLPLFLVEVIKSGYTAAETADKNTTALRKVAGGVVQVINAQTTALRQRQMAQPQLEE